MCQVNGEIKEVKKKSDGWKENVKRLLKCGNEIELKKYRWRKVERRRGERIKEF